MHQEAAKGVCADFAFADVFVAIHATTQGNLGIVDVEDRDALEADGAID
jgi:hypothetical protein